MIKGGDILCKKREKCSLVQNDIILISFQLVLDTFFPPVATIGKKTQPKLSALEFPVKYEMS